MDVVIKSLFHIILFVAIIYGGFTLLFIFYVYIWKPLFGGIFDSK